MRPVPAIALRRRQTATENWINKLDALERLLTEGGLERFPKRYSVASFASWEDDELGVKPLSRSVIYDEDPEYLALRRRMEHLLARVAAKRVKAKRKSSAEDDMKVRLEDANARAEKFKNQYSSAMAELSEAKNEIARLNDELRRKITHEAKISPIRRAWVKANPPDSGT